VKRTILVICALVLLLDLADDGHLGNVKFVAPDSPVESLKTSCECHKSGQVESLGELPRANFLGIPYRYPSQPATPVVRTNCKIIVSSLLSSAGGLPW
jgi:hypothetical protein